MIKLCVFDVDGTLITKGNRQFSYNTITALKNLQKQGVKLAIASGRPPFAMEKKLLDEITFDYFICSNGACVIDSKDEILHRFSFTKQQTQKLIDIFRTKDDALMFQCIEAARCYHGYKRIAHMLGGFLGRLDILSDEREQRIYQQKSLPLAAVAKIEHEDLQAIKEHFPELLFTPFDTTYYDINGQHSKADGIACICKHIGIDMTECAAFGDDYNDLDMIKRCGYGIAMGNAREKVKEAAAYVTSNVEEDGIWNACLHYGWIKQ